MVASEEAASAASVAVVEVVVEVEAAWQLESTTDIHRYVPQGQPYFNGCFNWMMNQILTWEMVVSPNIREKMVVWGSRQWIKIDWKITKMISK